MFLNFPTLTEDQKTDIQMFRSTNGWKLVEEHFETMIEVQEKALVNWEFKRNTDNTVQQKNLAEFEKKQLEIGLAKEMLHFIQSCDTMHAEDKNTEIY